MVGAKLLSGFFFFVMILMLPLTTFAQAKFKTVEVGLSGERDRGGIFKDVDSTFRSFEAIKSLKDRNVIQGYGDGTFRPEALISRAEFLKIAMLAAGMKNSENSCARFSDVVAGDWFAPFICTAVARGIVEGYGDGTFKPNSKINFAEASKLSAKILDQESFEKGSAEVDKFENWFEPFVRFLEKEKAIPASIRAFAQNLSRGEMAEIVTRLQSSEPNAQSNTYDLIKYGLYLEKPQSGELPRFSSCNALRAYEEVSDAGRTLYLKQEGFPNREMTAKNTLGDENYSGTNVQVEGVDEGDIVKTDGKRIFFAGADGKVRVLEILQNGSLKELSVLNFSEQNFVPKEMYLADGKLSVVGSAYDNSLRPMSKELVEEQGRMMWPGPYQGQNMTKVLVYGVAENGVLDFLREENFSGDYVSSRRIEDNLYLVMNRSFFAKNSDEDCAKVAYVPGSFERNYLLVASVPLKKNDGVFVESILGARAENVYAGKDNLYVAVENYSFGIWWGRGDLDNRTDIYKFALGGGDVRYVANGSVKGNVLNQFSLDEYEGNLRLATTTGNFWSGDSTNNVFILDEKLRQIGALEGLAKGEKIYSARFMGEKAYLVTFKNVDPLFVLDLSEAKAPKVLGELKIPGYSDYLHPLGGNLLIGVGKEAVPAQSNFAWYQGMKLALFDVSDLAKPKQLHSLTIGDRGTHSTLLYDHKALLFENQGVDRAVMAFPLTVAQISPEVKGRAGSTPDLYGDIVFQGAYVFDVSQEKGFDLRGKITHYKDEELQSLKNGFWYGGLDIIRIIRVGGFFYTFSEQMAKAVDVLKFKEAGILQFGK